MVKQEEEELSIEEEEEEEQKNKKKQKQKKKKRKAPFGRDEEEPKLVVPKLQLDSEEEANTGHKLAEVRKKKWVADRNAELEAIEELSADEYDPDVAIGYASPKEDAEQLWHKAKDAVAREEDDLFSFDNRTGKLTLTREPRIKMLPNYQLFTPDMSILLCGIRRSGKTFALRDLLYHLSPHYEGGLVFSATAHNGFWAEHIPTAYIHPEVDGTLIDRYLEYRAEVIRQHQRDFGADATDAPYTFILLDDCVDQQTRYDKVLLLLVLVFTSKAGRSS